MGIMEHKQLNPAQIEAVVGLLEGLAQVSELTESNSALQEIEASAKLIFGVENWRKIQANARKFVEVLASDTDTSGTTVVDPQIQTMSLQDRKTTLRQLRRMGLDAGTEADETFDAAPELVPGLFERLARLSASGRATRAEVGRWHNVSRAAELARLEIFVESREALPEGTFRE